MKNNNKWDSLSIKDKADLMKLYVKNGINNLEEIRSHYNKFATGGYTEEEGIQKIADKVNTSKANFVERLKDPNREFIKDWASDAIATHKLGVATDNKGNHYIYPEVQRIKGKLIDFTRPPYAEWAGMKTAEERGDTVRVNSIEEGLKFTENYKKYYPTFNKFQDGGETENNKNEAIYYDDTYLEPVVVKAFNSEEEYNRHQGEKFANEVIKRTNNVAPYVLEALTLPLTIASAIETPFLLYQGAKAIPSIIKTGKSLFNKGKKVIGEKILGMVDDINNYTNIDSHFRIVDKPAIDDAVKSGLIRAKTGLYHGTPEYLKANFSKYLDDIPGWEKMDANELRKLLESKGAFEGMDDAAKFKAKLMIRNSTNQGGTVHYFKGRPYPNYNVSKNNYVIETPETTGSFVAGHKGREYTDIPLSEAGSTLLKTNNSIKEASIPSKGSSYWQYSPFWDMWKNTKFGKGGKLNKFSNGGERNTINLVLKDTSPTYNNWQEAINDSWYKPVYDNMWVGTIPYKSMYQNKDATTKLSKNTTIDNFINVMYPIVEQSMISKGKSLKNVDNMVKQIAYESNYGRSSRGNGYNLAGIKEFDSSKPRTKYKDGQYYKNFNDYRDFTDYYVDLVTNRYEVENADNLKDYVDKLHGKNSSGKSYSTNKKYYRDMKNMKTLDKKIKDYKK